MTKKIHEQQYCVYRHITIDDNITFYVGQDNVFGARMVDMKNRNHVHKGVVKKHGARFEVIEFCKNHEEVSLREIFWIMKFHTYIQDPERVIHAANLSSGGDGGKGYKWTEEQRKMHSVRCTGRIPSESMRKNISNTLKGRKLSEEHKRNKGLAQRGIKRTEETRKNMHIAAQRPETKEKRRKAAKLVQNRPEIKKAKQEKMLGAKHFAAVAVEQYTLDGIFIAKYDTLTSACKVAKSSHVEDVCKGNRLHAGGFIWKFSGANPPLINCVEQYTKQMCLISTFTSLVDAMEKTNIRARDINAVCRGARRTAGGFIWKYAPNAADVDQKIVELGKKYLEEHDVDCI